MGYEPKAGDLVKWPRNDGSAALCRIVDGEHTRDVTSAWANCERADGALWESGVRVAWIGRAIAVPLRPDAVGQRVRACDGRKATITLMDYGRPFIEWDDLPGQTHGFIADALVRIADKAEPSGRAENKPIPTAAAPTDAWPNRPQCGRPGHDPACLCSTGWVRPVEAEPKVHETWATRDGGRWVEATRNPAFPRLYERAYVVNGGPLMPTRELAIAAWRARHG